MAKVFISYSHDSSLHKRRIHDLAAHLRAHHLDVAIDQDQLPGGPDEGCSDLHPWFLADGENGMIREM